MKTIMHLALLSLLFTAGCATGSYQVASTPADANVDAIYANGVRKNLGKTPLNGKDADINPAKLAVTFEITKENFERQQIFVPESATGKDVTINVNLLPIPVSADAQGNEKRISSVAENVAQIQRDVQGKEYDQALAKINRMIAENPRVATFYSLAGNVYYLQKRTDKALANYKRAKELDPQSTDLAKIIDKLEGLRPQGGAQ